jgi:SP family arabinose:H+ symporter-like MFS transporter
VSIATLSLWAACTLVTLTFLNLLRALGPSGTFGVYASLSAGACLFVWRFLPETKGRTLEQISRSWSRPEGPEVR